MLEADTASVKEPSATTPEAFLMAEKLKRIQQNPALKKLLAQPNRIMDIVGKDPNLRGLLSSNPQLQSLLQPEKIQEVLNVAQNPEQLLAGGQGGGLFGLGGLEDLPKHRMNIMQVRATGHACQPTCTTMGRLLHVHVRLMLGNSRGYEPRHVGSDHACLKKLCCVVRLLYTRATARCQQLMWTDPHMHGLEG